MAVFGPLSGQARGRSPVGGHLGCFESFAVRTRQPFQGNVSVRGMCPSETFPEAVLTRPERTWNDPRLSAWRKRERQAPPHAPGGVHMGVHHGSE